MSHEIQTPKKELLHLSSNRKAKSSNSQSKKLNHLQQKIVKKSLSSVFTPFTENDAVSDKESSQISPISASVDDDRSSIEVSDNGVRIQHPEVSAGISSVSDAFASYEDPFSESRESSIVSLEHFISPLSVKSGSVEMSPLSSTTTAEKTPALSTITTEAAAVFVTSDGATTEEMTSFETESLVKLRESMFPVLHSADIKPINKRLWDELAKMETQECYGLYEERGLNANLFSRKEMILLLSFLLGILAVLARFFLFTDVQRLSYGPPPT